MKTYKITISLDQYNRHQSMTSDAIALEHFGELSTESVKFAHNLFNQCRAIEAKIGHENRLRNFATWKPESRRTSNAIERAEVAHYEG